jgi:hypothetical protein
MKSEKFIKLGKENVKFAIPRFAQIVFGGGEREEITIQQNQSMKQ